MLQYWALPGGNILRFNDEQTARAIQIIANVVRDSGTPLPSEDDVCRWETLASQGDEASAVLVMTAKLRLIFPVVPPPAGSDRYRLWQIITSGRYEAILIAKSLDYGRAAACGQPPPLGSYLERQITGRVKNELAVSVTEGWMP